MARAGLTVGLERLAAEPRLAASWGRCGLVCNQASVARDFTPAWRVAHTALRERLVALFGPQHGLAGTAQDNMIETGHGRHLATGLPVYSLYSETREPTAEMLAGLDTLLIDLQIVGCRIYTWKSTIAACLRAAKKHGRRVVVLDRPNPLGGVHLEGRVLDDDAHSFVGEFPIPMRHGLTAGEAARFFNASIGAELEVVALEGWDPKLLAHHYYGPEGRPWVLTSPNLPTLAPVFVYPGTVLLEGCNISEGRGTGLPFQLIGAPYIQDSARLVARIGELSGDGLPGVFLREAAFEPTSQKHMGKVCNGLQIHVTGPDAVRSFRLTLALIRAFIEQGEGGFQWKQPPYEYDHVTLPIKLIIGSRAADRHLEKGAFSVQDAFWRDGIQRYIAAVKPHLLYARSMLDVT
jgi:uncharacterized protein YbbC (DUF1343 family)